MINWSDSYEERTEEGGVSERLIWRKSSFQRWLESDTWGLNLQRGRESCPDWGRRAGVKEPLAEEMAGGGRPLGWNRAREGEEDWIREGGQGTRWCIYLNKKNSFFWNKGNYLFGPFSESKNIFKSH